MNYVVIMYGLMDGFDGFIFRNISLYQLWMSTNMTIYHGDMIGVSYLATLSVGQLRCFPKPISFHSVVTVPCVPSIRLTDSEMNMTTVGRGLGSGPEPLLSN